MRLGLAAVTHVSPPTPPSVNCGAVDAVSVHSSVIRGHLEMNSVTVSRFMA